jgi:hypothetical protein
MALELGQRLLSQYTGLYRLEGPPPRVLSVVLVKIP